MSISVVFSVTAVLLTCTAVFLTLYFKKINKKNNNEQLVRAFANLAAGNTDEALEELKKIALSGSGNPEVYTTLAVLYRKRHEPVKTIRINEALISRNILSDDEAKEVLKELIFAYKLALRDQKNKSLVKSLERHIENNDLKLPEFLCIKALFKKYTGEYDDAVKYYQKYEKSANTDCSKDICDTYLLAASLSAETSKAVKYLKQAVAANPKSRRAYFALVKSLEDEDNKQQALAMAGDIISNDLCRTRDDIDNIENIYFQYSTVDELFNIMYDRIKAGSRHPVPYLFLFHYYLKKNDKPKALGLLQKYLQTGKTAIIVKEYIRICEDPVIASVLKIRNIYKCSVCGNEQSQYTDYCGQCESAETLDYF